MLRTVPTTLTALLVCACVVPQHPAAQNVRQPEPAAAKPSESEPLPYPEPDLQEQIDNLHLGIAQLEAQIEQLNTRIRQLEQRPAARPRPQNSRSRSAADTQTSSRTDHSLAQAQTAYRQGRYQDVLQLLAAADNGGSGNETDRRKMQLLLQSQQRLDNCQSVIVIGQRYAVLFSGKSGAADALYSVGQCQWRIQQRDIAADTWRKLLRTYPDSQAAKRAAARLNH